MGSDFILKSARALIEEGVDVGVTKRRFEETLLELGKKARRPGETDAAAVARFVTTTADGRALMKAAAAAVLALPKAEPSRDDLNKSAAEAGRRLAYDPVAFRAALAKEHARAGWTI